MSKVAMAHDAFELLRSEHIVSLNLDVQQFEHRVTGAMHYHLAADNNENVFLVALRTVPHDSTGVAHMLEHTALCGSERYPVRDPFFLMLRRSLNTFMNAFTSSDWTAYPFASQNGKDFNNLLQVYLDAVFFSNLDPLDFAQEGHRLEFSESENPASDLVFKGIVFNEMKGAMSSVSSALWQTLCQHLFPTNTYHYNSGGDPACIPDLTYQQLQDFYRTHYHPSNAIFMTFGDMPARQHQQAFEELALARFERLETGIVVPAEQRLIAPIRVQDCYAFDDSGSTEHKTHIVMAWLLGDSSNLEQLLEAQLLASVLLDNSASPLQLALETTALGQSPSPLCGLEESMREIVFACGIEGSEAEHVEALEELVLGVLQKVSDEGVESAKLEAVLHQLELHQREISGDSYPYGLQLILTALGCATHYADPIAALNVDPVLELLRQRIQDPDYIRGLAKQLLLDNQHRVTLVMTPDQTLSTQRQQQEKDKLAALKSAMTDADKQAVIQGTKALAKRQAQDDDDSILPKVELADVPPTVPELHPIAPPERGFPCVGYAQGTNGLVYQQLVTPLPALDSAELAVLSYYSNALTELGLGDSSYLQVQDRQSATCGSINAFTSLRGEVDDEQRVRAMFVVSSKALARNHQQQGLLMRDTLESARFDEFERIGELVAQTRARREQSVPGNGHGLAMAAACAGMSPLAAVNHELSGLAGIRACKLLDDSLSDSTKLGEFAEKMQLIHHKVARMPRQFLAVAEHENLAAVMAGCESNWGELAPGDSSAATFSPPAVREMRREIWVANTQVNFCAHAYPTVAVGHEDAAALTVLGGFLRNGYLHSAIREQGGAYGGGASQDSSIGAFRLYSYRDPRLAETLTDFDKAIHWMLDSSHDEQALEQAILGVIGSLDKPSSPAGEAKQHFHNSLFGRTHAQREQFRARILALTLADLHRVTETYLKPECASIAVVTSKSGLKASTELVKRLQLQVQEL